MNSTPKVVLIMGPTASGKTDLAIALAEKYPFDIISVDSAMVYRGMDIGTAKPDQATLARFPHRLINILDPAQAYSAAEFCHDANVAIEESFSHGRWPLLVGGTFLYFNAWIHGLTNLPSADARLRSQISARAEQQGWPAVHQELAAVDAVSAARIHPNDPQRIQRALEVFYSSGKPLSVWHNEEKKSASQFPLCKLILAPQDRNLLASRIEKRFQTMLNLGLVEEVEKLFRRSDLNDNMPSIRSVGYRQVWQWLNGEYSYSEMREKAVIATRQFAKRQYTWLRREKSQPWIDPINDQVIEIAKERLKLVGFPL